MTLVEVQVKWSVILMDRFGPDNFSTLQIKGHVLHRALAHLKVPAWLLVWNALLTRKLPMFLSRLNEISGGCEKILPVSGSYMSNTTTRVACMVSWRMEMCVKPHGLEPTGTSETENCLKMPWGDFLGLYGRLTHLPFILPWFGPACQHPALS